MGLKEVSLNGEKFTVQRNIRKFVNKEIEKSISINIWTCIFFLLAVMYWKGKTALSPKSNIQKIIWDCKNLKINFILLVLKL